MSWGSCWLVHRKHVKLGKRELASMEDLNPGKQGVPLEKKHSSCTKELEKERWAGHSDGLGKTPHTARGAR